MYWGIIWNGNRYKFCFLIQSNLAQFYGTLWAHCHEDMVLSHVSQHISPSNSNFMEIGFYSNSISDWLIATKFCTCHNSTAVVSCAKFGYNHHSVDYNWDSSILSYYIKMLVKSTNIYYLIMLVLREGENREEAVINYHYDENPYVCLFLTIDPYLHKVDYY